MTDSENTTRDELEELREGMKSLRDSLSTQKIVSEKLLRRIMAKDSAWMNKYVNYEIFLLSPFAILLFLAIKIYLGTSGIFFAFTATMFIVDAAWDYRIVRMPPSDFAALPMLTLKKKIVEQMNARKIQLMVELPLIFVWAGWFMYELSASNNIISIHLGWIGWAVNVTLGLICGIIAVCILYNKFQKQARELLAQISDFENE